MLLLESILELYAPPRGLHKHTVVPRAEHLHDESVRFNYISVSVQLYPYPRAAPRHHASMKLLLHAMRMLAACACMVAAEPI